MDVYYDLEFLEDGATIELISIGMVTQHGDEYHAVNSELDVARVGRHDWLCKNVVGHLPLVDSARVLGSIERRVRSGEEFTDAKPLDFQLDRTASHVKPVQVIANEVRDFLDVPELLLVSWFGAYDHVRLCQLWGPMVVKPAHVPMWTYDLRQTQYELGVAEDDVPPRAEGSDHDVLADAHHHRRIARDLSQRFGPCVAVGR